MFLMKGKTPRIIELADKIAEDIREKNLKPGDPYPGKTEGFVLVRSALVAQRLIAASGLPTVVHGSLHWSAPHMPWIDRDHRSGGALMTTHLLEAGFRRIAVLMRDRMLRGDHDLFD